MNILLNKNIQPTKERMVLVNFMVDIETQQIHIEGRSEKYDATGHLINKEPVRLLFRDENYLSALEYLLSDDAASKSLHMLLRKLEIDRCLEDNTLCNQFPLTIPPHRQG